MRVVQTFTVPMSLCFLEGQAHFWQQNGCDLHVLTSSKKHLQGNDLKEFGLQNGVQTYPICFQRKKDVWNSFLNLRQLIRYFSGIRPQIVHGNTPKAALLTMLAARFKDIPIRIYEMHGLPLETASFWGKIGWRIIENITCRYATHVIAVSPSLRNSAIQKGVVRAEKISVVHNGSCNGVDAENKFNPQKTDYQAVESLRKKYQLINNQPVVGFVGRLTRDKGIQELYDAWQIVKENYPTAKLLLVGGEDERAKLPKKLLSKIDKDASILRIGEKKNIQEYYALMDFLVLPSYREGLGNVVLEAAAMKKPAVVSNVTGLQDAVIENQTGIFCQAHSANDLAKKIKYYIQNPSIVQLYGNKARQRVQTDFIPADVWNAKRRLYQRLVTATESVTLGHVSPIFQTTD